MKTRLNYLFLSLLAFAILYSCSGDDDSGSETLSSSKQITKFIFNATNNEALDANITATVNENDKTITAQVPYGTNVTSLVPTIEVSPKATVSPEGAKDFSSEITYTVTAEDNSEANYTVTVTVTPHNEAKILSFVFLAENNTAIEEDVTAIIDEEAKTVTAEVPYNTDITALIPSVDVSPGATFTPEGTQDFSSEVIYTVTAQDGTKADYIAIVTVIPNNEAKLLSFVFLADNNPALEDDLIATIDEATKTMTAAVPHGTDITGLMPALEVSPNASFNPEGAQDFSSEVVYTVTAQDGTIAEYTLHLTIALSEREVLIAIYNANPGNTLGWDLEDPDINNWAGIGTDENNKVIALVLRYKSLITIPTEIGQLSNLTNLDLDGNQITGLPAEIGQLSKLTSFNIPYNELTIIPAEIRQLTNLTGLDLSQNNLTALPSEIGQLTNLTKLILGNNQMTAIPSEIGQLTNLRHLSFESNDLTAIPLEFGQLTELRVLQLGGNQLTSIPSEIGQLIQLEKLYLSNNQLFAIPAEIGQFINLTHLNLYNNQLTALPSEIGQLNNLTELDLRVNPIISIPQEVCDLNTNYGTTIYTDEGITCE